MKRCVLCTILSFKSSSSIIKLYIAYMLLWENSRGEVFSLQIYLCVGNIRVVHNIKYTSEKPSIHASHSFSILNNFINCVMMTTYCVDHLFCFEVLLSHSVIWLPWRYSWGHGLLCKSLCCGSVFTLAIDVDLQAKLTMTEI